MPRLNKPKITILTVKGHKYYLASITILQKRYRKTFAYTKEGYTNAEEFIKHKQATCYK